MDRKRQSFRWAHAAWAAALLLIAATAVAGNPTQRVQQTPANNSVERLFSATAAIIEGDVADISFSYDDWLGPRTNVRLHGVVTHAGPFSDREVTLRLLGGPRPDGRILVGSHMPTFHAATRYLVLLRRGPWRSNPIVTSLAVVPAGDVDFLANDSGMAVSSFDEQQGIRWDAGLRLFTSSRDHIARFDKPVRSPLLDSVGSALKSRITTKTFLLEGLRVAAKKYGVPFGLFNPMPEQDVPWNVISTTADGTVLP